MLTRDDASDMVAAAAAAAADDDDDNDATRTLTVHATLAPNRCRAPAQWPRPRLALFAPLLN